MSCYENNNLKWNSLLKKKKTPVFYTGLINIKYSDLKNKIGNNNVEYQDNLIEELYNGKIIQFTDAISQNDINFIIEEAKKISKNNSSTNTKCVQGVQNFFYLQLQDHSKEGGYKTLDRSHYFFPWNIDSKLIFEKINKYWSLIKILGGQHPDKYNDHLPSDGIINRIHVIQYLTGGGTISAHNDPYEYQRIQVGSVLNDFGKDFKQGGFAVFNENKQKVCLEPKIQKGSLICFFPSLIHLVNPIDPERKLDAKSDNGRWYLSLASVGSEHKIDRKKSVAQNLETQK